MTARVREVTAASAAAGSRLRVRGSTSAKTTLPPARVTASEVAIKVRAGTMTSSPGFIPNPLRARTRASVPLPTPTQCLTPR